MKPEIKDYIDCYFKKQKYAPPKIIEDAFESLIVEVWEAAVKHTENRFKRCSTCKFLKFDDDYCDGCLSGDYLRWVAYDR